MSASTQLDLIATLLDLSVYPAVILLLSGKLPAVGYALSLTLTSTMNAIGMVLAWRVSRLAIRNDDTGVLAAPLLLFGLPLGALPGSFLST